MAHTRTPTHGHPADGSHTHARAPRKVGMDESNQSMQCERYPPLTLGGMRVSLRDPPIGEWGEAPVATWHDGPHREGRARMQCPRSISCVLVANELQCRTRVDHAPPDSRRPTAQRGGSGVRPGHAARSGRSPDARLIAERTHLTPDTHRSTIPSRKLSPIQTHCLARGRTPPARPS